MQPPGIIYSSLFSRPGADQLYCFGLNIPRPGYSGCQRPKWTNTGDLGRMAESTYWLESWVLQGLSFHLQFMSGWTTFGSFGCIYRILLFKANGKGLAHGVTLGNESYDKYGCSDCQCQHAFSLFPPRSSPHLPFFPFHLNLLLFL